MKNIISSIVILCLISLTGCATQKQTEVLVKTQYIVRTAPTQLKTLPAYPAPINVETADQVALAKWINSTDGYIYDLESMITNLINFYEKPVDQPISTGAGPVKKKYMYIDPIQRRVMGIKD